MNGPGNADVPVGMDWKDAYSQNISSHSDYEN